jgi:hypothetical protein
VVRFFVPVRVIRHQAEGVQVGCDSFQHADHPRSVERRIKMLENQEMAEACKRLIKNCIICWNYLYLSQKLEDSEDAASREAFLEAVANGSAVSWQHINLLGEYDFSDEKLQDTVGIKPPKLADQRDTFLGVAKRAGFQGRNDLR